MRINHGTGKFLGGAKCMAGPSWLLRVQVTVTSTWKLGFSFHPACVSFRCLRIAFFIFAATIKIDLDIDKLFLEDSLKGANAKIYLRMRS